MLHTTRKRLYLLTYFSRIYLRRVLTHSYINDLYLTVDRTSHLSTCKVFSNVFHWIKQPYERCDKRWASYLAAPSQSSPLSIHLWIVNRNWLGNMKRLYNSSFNSSTLLWQQSTSDWLIDVRRTRWYRWNELNTTWCRLRHVAYRVRCCTVRPINHRLFIGNVHCSYIQINNIKCATLVLTEEECRITRSNIKYTFHWSLFTIQYMYY